tara:strand:+ start:7 stop:345 length:339 start_codon:yes stop_codon:yes gene_type:complete
MPSKNKKYHFNLGMGEEAMLYGQGSKGVFDFETNILNQLISNLLRGKKKSLINKPSLSLGFEGGNIHPALENLYATIGTNVYSSSPEHRTDKEWEMGQDALMDWLLNIGIRF